MPHCIVEYSQSLESKVEISDLLKAVNAGAIASALFSDTDIKLRAMPFQYALTNNDCDDFIHISVRILSGRNLLQRQMLSQEVKRHVNELQLSSVVVTVEIIDMERESYSKTVC